MKNYYRMTVDDIVVDADVTKVCPMPERYNEKVWNYTVSEAKKDKIWALDTKENDEWWKSSSLMSHKILLDDLKDDVCAMAKEKYDYFRLRSHARSKSTYLGYSLWIDPEAHDKWEAITGEEIVPDDI